MLTVFVMIFKEHNTSLLFLKSNKLWLALILLYNNYSSKTILGEDWIMTVEDIILSVKYGLNNWVFGKRSSFKIYS